MMELNLEFEAITEKMASLLPTSSIVVEEALVRLFNYASSSIQLLLLCLFSFSIFLLTFFTFIGRFPLIQRDQQHEYVFSDDEEEQEEPHQEKYCYADSTTRVRDHILAADSNICGRGTLLFHHNKNPHSHNSEEFITPRESLTEESQENHSSSSEITLSIHNSPQVSDFETEAAEEEEEEFPATIANNSVTHSFTNPVLMEHKSTSPTTLNLYKDDHVYLRGGTLENRKVKEENLTTRDERFFVFSPTELHSKKLIVQEKDDDEGGESCSDDGSITSKEGSSEWRSSIHFKDYETDHEEQFSSSSRRSCPKWESYTLFQKYDEEMSFLDRISAQKLQETESLKSIQVSPRSISERIAHKFSTANKTPAADTGHNPYRELEAAYVAQICLTWEALNWNYRNFQSKHASHSDNDTGCPATVAQQFQQFQVLLQRYIENEPYEHGRRPEIYARMRLLAPKLLLVPEYRDSEDNQKDGGLHSRISSASFLMIMEDGIRTFMKFLKADKEKPCQILATYFRRNRRCTVDPTLLRLMKKVNQKKRMKVKDLQRSRKCLRKRKVKVEAEGMDILIAKIDLKVVGRVLRMSELNEAQLHWCEEKMSKVRIMSGKLHTHYSTPLFFPSLSNSFY